MFPSTCNTLGLSSARNHQQKSEENCYDEVIDEESHKYRSEGGSKCPIDVKIEKVGRAVKMCVYVVAIGESQEVTHVMCVHPVQDTIVLD